MFRIALYSYIGSNDDRFERIAAVFVRRDALVRNRRFRILVFVGLSANQQVTVG